MRRFFPAGMMIASLSCAGAAEPAAPAPGDDPKPMPVFRGGCYFIRQVNQNLKAPKDKPEFILLAAEPATPAYFRKPDCIAGTLVRKAVLK